MNADKFMERINISIEASDLIPNIKNKMKEIVLEESIKQLQSEQVTEYYPVLDKFQSQLVKLKS